MSTAARVIKNTGFLYLRLGASLIISLWTTRIVLNALGFDNFGIYNVVGGTIALLGFLNGTLSTATQRYINYAEGQKNPENQLRIFNNSFLLHLILGVILLVSFAIMGIICFNGLLDIPESRMHAAKIVYCCMCFTALLSVMNVTYEASIVAHEDMQYYAYIGIIEVIAKLAIAFTIKYATTDRLILYGFLMMGVPIFTFILMRIYCHKRYAECKIAIKRYKDKTTLKELSHFAGWNFINAASGVVTQYGLNIVINHFFGVLLNAAQGITNQVSGVISTIVNNAQKALNPIIIKSESSHQRNRMIYVTLLSCRISFFIFTLISFPLIVEMNVVLKLWLNNVPNWAVIFCQLQLIRIITEMPTNGLVSSIIAEGNIKAYNIWRSAVNFIPLFAVYFVFKFGFEPYWMYIIWTVCWSGIGGLINIIFAHKNTGMGYDKYLKEALIPMFYSISIPSAIVLISYLITDSHFINFLVLIIAESLFILLSWKLLLQQQEKSELIRILKKIIKSKN